MKTSDVIAFSHIYLVTCGWERTLETLEVSTVPTESGWIWCLESFSVVFLDAKDHIIISGLSELEAPLSKCVDLDSGIHISAAGDDIPTLSIATPFQRILQPQGRGRNRLMGVDSGRNVELLILQSMVLEHINPLNLKRR